MVRTLFTPTILAVSVCLLTSCVGSNEPARTDNPFAAHRTRSGDDLPRTDVRTRLPDPDSAPDSTPDRRQPSATALAARDEVDPVAAPGDTSIQAALAQDADEHAKRLAAMVRATPAPASAPRATPEPLTAPAASPPPSPPADPDALAALVVAGLKSGKAPDDRPLVQALLDAAAASELPTSALDLSRHPSLTASERDLVLRFHAAFRSMRPVPPSTQVAASDPPIAPLAPVTSPTPPESPPDAATVKRTLSIPRFDLATKVEGFGRVATLTDRRFLPGRPTQIVLYVEIDDFDSQRDEKSGEWTTSLASKVAIYAKHDGTEVWSRDWQAVVDRSPVKRDDFFICEKIALSEYLTVGTYAMKTTVRDERTGALAEKSIEFQIVADPGIAQASAPRS